MLRTHLMLGWMNLALSAPVIYLLIGLPLVMRQQGLGGTHIGLLQLAALPALFKFVLAAPIERRAPGRVPMRNYRQWAIWLGLAYAATLAVLAAHPPAEAALATLFCLILLANLLATWCDVPINALAIALLPEAERLRAGAVKSAAMALAAIIGGGGMLLLHARQGWACPLLLLAAGMLSCALLVPCLPSGLSPGEPRVAPAAAPPAVCLRLIAGWFSTPQNRLWALLLLLYYPPVGAAWVYLKPLLLDAGLAPEAIAWLVGVAGGLVAALASLAASRIARRLGAWRALPWFALGDMLALAALFGAVASGLGALALGAAALLLALMVGASAGLVFGLMMQRTRPHLPALDYGIQSSLFLLGRTVIPMLAGLAFDRFGPTVMLGGLLTVLVLVWALAYLPQHPSRAATGA